MRNGDAACDAFRRKRHGRRTIWPSGSRWSLVHACGTYELVSGLALATSYEMDSYDSDICWYI